MCLGAYSLYKNRQINNPIYDKPTTKTSNELVCEAIPETVFNKEYINSWNTWNANEIPNQIKVGVEEMVKQCSQNISSEQKQILIKKYCSLATQKNEMKEGEFYRKHCIERMSNMISLDFINSKDSDAKMIELLNENNNDLSFDNMLKDGIKEFLNIHVYSIPRFNDYKINFFGSVSYLLRDIISEELNKKSCQIGTFKKKPIISLFNYHFKK